MRVDESNLLLDFLHHLKGIKTHSAVIITGIADTPVFRNNIGWLLTEAHDHQQLKHSHVYFAPSGYTISVFNGKIILNAETDPDGRADLLFKSLASEKNAERVAVILSSDAEDGINGISALAKSGGAVLVHDRMDSALINENFTRLAGLMGTTVSMADYLIRLMQRKYTDQKIPAAAEQPWLRLFSTVIAQADEAIMIVEAVNEEAIVYVNDAFTLLTGYSKPELMFRSPSQFLYVQADAENGIEMVLPQDLADGIEKKILHKEGREIWISQKMIPYLDVTDNCTHLIYMIRDATESRRRDQALTMAVYAGNEKLRQELSAELHDNVNQILVTTQVTLGMAKNANAGEIPELIKRGNDYINMAIDEIRRLSHDIAPQVFDTDTFFLALRDLANGMNADKRFQLRFHFDPELARLKPENETLINLYRIVQEQMKNILSYSEAARISLSLGVSHGHYIRLRIADNGRGFDPHQERRGMGLTNMRRRAEFLYGSFNLITAPGKGCVIVVEVPV